MLSSFFDSVQRFARTTLPRAPVTRSPDFAPRLEIFPLAGPKERLRAQNLRGATRASRLFPDAVCYDIHHID